jgi:hypothetical protein
MSGKSFIGGEIMKRFSLIMVMLIVVVVMWLDAKENFKGGHTVLIDTDTLTAADTSVSAFKMIYTEKMQGEYCLTYEIINVANNTKWKLFHIYGNDTTVMADTVKIDSLQAEKNGSYSSRLKSALYHQWMLVSFGGATDKISGKVSINAASRR